MEFHKERDETKGIFKEKVNDNSQCRGYSNLETEQMSWLKRRIA